ncbi:MAG TPA: hypothetical protein VL361_03400 [Candidatus Limnocylindrales bacterium]|nr:hypothetical protein [Candidatus Limnocylindrales bacterium]
MPKKPDPAMPGGSPAAIEAPFRAFARSIAPYLLALFALSARAEGPLKLIQTVPLPDVKGRFDHFSMDAKGRRLFVAALGNNTVEVIDLTEGKRLHSITGMSKPQGVLYLPSADEILVANGDDGTLKALDAHQFQIKYTVSELPDADNVRFDRHSGAVWIGYGDGALAEVTPSGHKLTSTIKLLAHPESFQIEKTTSRIFVNVPDAKQIAVVDAKTHHIIGNWPMEKFQANFPMALHESTHRLFVGCRNPPRLLVFNTETGKQLQDLEIAADTDDLYFDEKRNRIYISCGAGFIDIIAEETPDSFKALATIKTAPGARTSFYSPDTDCFYLAVPDRGNQKAEIRIFKPQ